MLSGSSRLNLRAGGVRCGHRVVARGLNMCCLTWQPPHGCHNYLFTAPLILIRTEGGGQGPDRPLGFVRPSKSDRRPQADLSTAGPLPYSALSAVTSKTRNVLSHTESSLVSYVLGDINLKTEMRLQEITAQR